MLVMLRSGCLCLGCCCEVVVPVKEVKEVGDTEGEVLWMDVAAVVAAASFVVVVWLVARRGSQETVHRQALVD